MNVKKLNKYEIVSECIEGNSEYSCSVVECLTRGQGVAGLNLTGDTVLCS